jgi:hypothetical protein
MTIKRPPHLETTDSIPDLFSQELTPPEVRISRNNPLADINLYEIPLPFHP